MSSDYRVHPLVRSYGKARIEITRQARDEHDWQRMWRAPQNPFSFKWCQSWKHCVEYKVDDFASEVGFYIDLLGFPVHSFSPSYARLTSPTEDFFFAISAARSDEQATPTEALRLQFCIEDFEYTVQELKTRGINFEITDTESTSGWNVASFRTPHGIAIDLVGLADMMERDDETQESIQTSDILEVEESDAMQEDDFVDDENNVEENIRLDLDMDPVELVTRLNEEDQENDALLPFLNNDPQRRSRPPVRRPRVKSTPRFNEFSLNELKKFHKRAEKSNPAPERPRSNGEITYVEIEDGDDLEP
ncbi:MAG TPA: VOC family protein [Anaerolineales bacterium]|nr:VOC family protein [Anaerolineales bacterium]